MLKSTYISVKQRFDYQLDYLQNNDAEHSHLTHYFRPTYKANVAVFLALILK